jgi:hypothetical protein
MRSILPVTLLLAFASGLLFGRGAPGPPPPPIAFGTNVGHWLSQARLDRAEMATFFTEADVARIKGWGMDHIRVPVDSPLIADAADRTRLDDEGLSWLDRAAAWTRSAGLTLVLDMHHLPGHGFMSERTNTIWVDGPDRRQAIDLWRALARRYVGQPHVVFELLNEPVAPVGQDELWHALARDLVAAVRSVNEENWIMIGSNRWSNASTFRVLPRFEDPRVIYTFHFYDPFAFTHQRASWAPADIRDLKAPVPYPGPLASGVLHTDWLVTEFGWMTGREYGSGVPPRSSRARADVPRLLRGAGLLRRVRRARHGAIARSLRVVSRSRGDLPTRVDRLRQLELQERQLRSAGPEGNRRHAPRPGDRRRGRFRLTDRHALTE